MKHIYVKILLFFSAILLPFIVFSQNKTEKQDTRSKNRRFADSMYYVHTVKKQQTEIKNNDTLRLSATDLKSDTVRHFISGIGEVPCATLYQNTWYSERVKSGNISLKDLPDELTLRLLGRGDTGTFYFPYKGPKTSPYGWRWGRAHTGVDIALNTGDKVYAAFDGVVRVARYNGGYGNMVLIRHYNNLETLYGHMSVLKVKPGQKVRAGDVIGLGGSTGKSTGPHLHFECRILYACIDPEWIVDIKNNKLKTKVLKIDKSYFGVPASQAIADNKTKTTSLSKVNKVMEGTRYIPNSELNKIINEKEKKKNAIVTIDRNADKSKWKYYTVKEGDTVEKICMRFHVTEKDLVEVNNIKDKKLTINKRLRIR
ncbi:MAG: peptidoglycan DD-metalloendopeptidase family protein [Bacteroidales bacterium]|nr:peptidoglycan DD-metalloendopeptidase family protein [Bacteroidales bacterium]